MAALVSRCFSPQHVSINNMAAHWSLKEVTEGWSKWQIALCVGAPIALGVAGVWLYRRRKSTQNTDDRGSGDAQTVRPKSVVEESKKTPQELAQIAKNKGNKYFKGGMYDKAIECYTEAIRICPTEHKDDISTFYQNRAAAFENLKNFQKVVSDCSTALEFKPRYIKALGRRAKAYEHMEQFRDALEDITTVCILEGFQNQASLQVADRVLKEQGRARARETYQNQKPSLPSKFYVRNYLAGFAKDPILKIEDIGKVGCSEKQGSADQQDVPPEGKMDEKGERLVTVTGEDNSEENGDAVLLEKPSAFERAKDLVEADQYDEVITLCTEEIETAGSKLAAEALLLRATFHILMGQGEEGLTDLDALLRIEGARPEVKANALVKKGSLLMQKDHQTEALECFSTAERVDPNNSDVYHHRGQQHLLVEKLDEAIEDFDKSISLSPDFPTSYIQKAFAEHRRAMIINPMSLETAHKSFEATVKKFPKCSDAYMLYGQALSDIGKFEEADRQFVKALELEPNNANTIVHHGLLMLQWKSDIQEALKLINAALAMDPMCEYAYEILGTISVQQGNMAKAVEMFEKAIQLSKSESEMAHLYSLLDAAQVQMKVAQKLGIPIPLGGGVGP